MKSRMKYRESRSGPRQFLLKIRKKLRIDFIRKSNQIITLQCIAMIEVEGTRLTKNKAIYL